MDRYPVKSEADDGWTPERHHHLHHHQPPSASKLDASTSAYDYRNDALPTFPLDFYSRHHQAFLSAYSNVPNFAPQQYAQQPCNALPPPATDPQQQVWTKLNNSDHHTTTTVKPKLEDPKKLDYDKNKYNFPDPVSYANGGTDYYDTVDSNSLQCNNVPKGGSVYNENNNPTADDADKISKEIRFSCWKCKCTFPSKYELREHYKMCMMNENGRKPDAEPKGKYSCDSCPYVCQSPATLKIHERIHSGEKPFSCSFCDYKSGQKNNVSKHILVHMKKKPYKCQYCDYRCAQKNNLVVHERTHTGFKPFACTFCEYKTVQKPNLVKHMYLHTNEKPFACDVCDYRCVQKTNLTKHKQKHTMEKPYVCTHCDYRSSQKVNLNKHMSVHKKYAAAAAAFSDTSENSFKCEQCTFQCVLRADMDRHMKLRHDPLKKESDECSVGVGVAAAFPDNPLVLVNGPCDPSGGGGGVVYDSENSVKIEAGNMNF